MQTQTNLTEAFKLYESLKSLTLIQVYPSVVRDTQLQVDFLERVFSKLVPKIINGKDEDGKAFEFTPTDFLEILFLGNSYSLSNKSNTDLSWTKVRGPYPNSKVTINNQGWAKKAEKIRIVLMSSIQNEAISPMEKTYSPSWRDIYRTPSIKTLMEPEIGRIIFGTNEARRLFYTHGFNKVAPFSLCLKAYKDCNFIILKTFSLAKDLLNNDTYFTKKDNVTKESVDSIFNGGVSFSHFALIQVNTGTKFSLSTFLEFGMHLSPFKLRENPIFVIPDLIKYRPSAEDELCQAIGDVMATVNLLTGTQFKTSYDYKTIWEEKNQGDNSDLRKAMKRISYMKKGIENCLGLNSNRFLQPPIPLSNNSGSSSIRGKVLF